MFLSNKFSKPLSKTKISHNNSEKNFQGTKSAAQKLLSLLALGSLLFTPSFVGLAQGTQTVNTNLTLAPGTLTLNTSGAACSLSATVSINSQTASCTISGVVITDTRGSGSGWNAVYTVRNFSSGNNLITLCGEVACTVKRLSVTWQAGTASSGNLLGATDSTTTYQPSSITNMTSLGTSNSTNLLSFSSANQTYALVTITSGGTGYSTAPTVTFTGGTCTQNPMGTASVSGGEVTAVTITTPGLGCTTAPTVGFTGGSGTGATAVAVAGAGEGSYTKNTTTNGFVLTIPALARAGSYTSVLSVSLS